ncbi:MAG: hypothetical protein AAGU14_11480 [Eubacteriaceae bacterium]
MVYKCRLPDGNISLGQENLIFRARTLNRDLATWLTLYLYSLYGGYANHDLIEEKLNQLPFEFGNMMKLIFGERAAEGYITMFSNYITILENLFHAQLSGDTNASNEYIKQLYENVDQVSAYLAQINPFWQESIWKTLLISFNDMILENYRQNIDIFDRLLSQSSVIGDYFSEGIYNYLIYSSKSISSSTI